MKGKELSSLQQRAVPSGLSLASLETKSEENSGTVAWPLRCSRKIPPSDRVPATLREVLLYTADHRPPQIPPGLSPSPPPPDGRRSCSGEGAASPLVAVPGNAGPRNRPPQAQAPWSPSQTGRHLPKLDLLGQPPLRSIPLRRGLPGGTAPTPVSQGSCSPRTSPSHDSFTLVWVQGPARVSLEI